jgi:hypothetical protein
MAGDRAVAEAFTLSADLTQAGLDQLRANGGRSTPVFEELISTFRALADRWAAPGQTTEGEQE